MKNLDEARNIEDHLFDFVAGIAKAEAKDAIRKWEIAEDQRRQKAMAVAASAPPAPAKPEAKFKAGQYVVGRSGTAYRLTTDATDGDSFTPYKYTGVDRAGIVYGLLAERCLRLAPPTPGCYDGDGQPCPAEFAKVDGRGNVPKGMMIEPEPRSLRFGDSWLVACEDGSLARNPVAEGDIRWIVVPDPAYKPEPVTPGCRDAEGNPCPERLAVWPWWAKSVNESVPTFLWKVEAANLVVAIRVGDGKAKPSFAVPNAEAVMTDTQLVYITPAEAASILAKHRKPQPVEGKLYVVGKGPNVLRVRLGGEWQMIDGTMSEIQGESPARPAKLADLTMYCREWPHTAVACIAKHFGVSE